MYRKVLIVLAILALNNVLLLSFMGYFSSSTDNETVSSVHSPSLTIEPNPATAKISAPPQQDGKSQESAVTQHESIEIEHAIQQYVYSDQFATVLDEWQLRFRQRSNEMKQRLATMSGQELHAVALDAESRSERIMAFNLLIEDGANRLKQLSNQQIKDIYTQMDSDHWSKASILSLLIKNGDNDALDWAKQAINENSLPRGANYDLYNSVYDIDPEFIQNHVEQLELDTSNPPNALLSLLYQETDLAANFLSQNFDKILDSKNDEIFMMGISNANLELTQRQQSRMVELFGSTSREKRSFAINLARNIDDTQLLREGYDQLTRKGEKMQFIVSLLHPGAKPEISNLAKELATSSDEPSIQNLINAYQIY